MNDTNTTTAVTQRQPRPVDVAKTFLTRPDLLNQLKMALPKTITPERMTRVALTAALGSPKLMECFSTQVGQASIARELMRAAQRGLEVDGRQGHLVPFYSKVAGQPGQKAMQAVFIPGYQGLMDLAYNHPNVAAIWVKAVYERDVFNYTEGLDRTLIHEPYNGNEDPGKLVASYAVCQLKSGAKVFVVLREREIRKIRNFSRGAAEESSPWNTDPEAMWNKSAIRVLCKMIPQSNELREAMNDDDVSHQILSTESSAGMGAVLDIAAAKVGEEAPTAPEKPSTRKRSVASTTTVITHASPAPDPEPELGHGDPDPALHEPTPANDDGDLGPQPSSPPEPTPSVQPAAPAPADNDPISALFTFVSVECGANLTLLTHCLSSNKLLKQEDADKITQWGQIPVELATKLMKSKGQLKVLLKNTI